MKRSVLAVLMVIFVIASTAMVGCGKKDTSGTKNGSAVEFKDDISMYVHVKVGGALDVRARIVADYLSQELGVNVNVVNVGGAGGVTCVTQMLAQPSSENDLLFSAASVFTASPLFTETTYTLDDFTPLVGVDVESFGLYTCESQTGFKSFEDVKDFAKTNDLIFGSGGIGNITHLYQAGLYQKLGITASTLSHDGAIEGIANTMGGHNMITMAGLETARSYVESGEIIPVMTFNSKDYTGYDGITVPSVTKVGGDEDNTYQSLMMISCLSSLNDENTQALESALRKVLANEDCIKDLKNIGLSEVPELTSEEIVGYINNEIKVMQDIIEAIK